MLKFEKESEVHVWQITCKEIEQKYENLPRFLDDDEIACSERFVHSDKSRQYSLAHGWLRLVLSQYFDDMDPQQLRFRIADKGKPHLEQVLSQYPIHFNLSHSHDAVMCAVSSFGEIGVDIEWHRPHEVSYIKSLAEHILTPKENKYMESLTSSEVGGFFYRQWVRKESVAKALGVGIYEITTSVDVRGGVPYLEEATNDHRENELQSCHIRDLLCYPDYSAALVTTFPVEHIWHCSLNEQIQPMRAV